MKKIVSIILSGLAMVSCVDTVLLPESKTVEEDFWQTKSDVNMMVNGAYASMAGKDLQQRLVVWTSRSDELNVNAALSNSNLNQIYSANIQTTNSYANWSNLYDVINDCNLVIEKSAAVMDIDPNYLEGDHLNNVGQMKALRALCYFYLVRVFRDVPLILEPYTLSSQEMSIPQSAPSVVIDQIIADLEEVKDNVLSTQSLSDWTRCGYFTRDGVYALLADVYLWKASIYGDINCYDKCIACCERIRVNREAASMGKGQGSMLPSMTEFDDDGFDLNPYYNYFDIFTTLGGNDDESLFELQSTNNEGLCIVYNKHKNNSNLPQFYTNSVYAKVSAGDNYVFNHANYIKDVRGFESVYSFNGGEEEGFAIRKFVAESRLTFMNEDELTAQIKIDRNYNPYDQNWIFYRVTDVMLMKAEAMAQKALLYANANADLVTRMESASTLEDSVAVAQEMLEVSKQVAGWNIGAARLVQIVNTRARIDGLSEVDSTKYGITNLEYNGTNASAFVRIQAHNFNGLASTSQDLEILVMNERARELCFEGKRWFDMLRYNYRHVTGVNYDVILGRQGSHVANYEEMLKLIARKYTSGGGSGVTSKMPTEPYLYMPVIQSEMSINPALVQNPVYTDGGTMEKNY